MSYLFPTTKKQDGIAGKLGAGKVRVLKINGQRPNEITKFDYTKYNIKSGETTLFVSAYVSRNVQGYGVIKFTAKPGETYEMKRTDEYEYVRIDLIDSSGECVDSIDAPKIQTSVDETFIPVPIFIPSN
jgi:hypothetical protein